ncbi:MAG: TM0106 family RecB-like putative nuclease [Burkholderiaceae bacterium]
MKKSATGYSLSPTDLAGHLTCKHLSASSRAVADGLSTRPVRFGPVIDKLRESGTDHEKAYLEHLRSSDHSITDLTDGSAHALAAAMKSGADVIYQPALSDTRWSGRADFLVKVPGASLFGPWQYEPVDTKLAREARAGAVLQLCVYGHLLEAVQGARPAAMHLVPPGEGFTRVSFRTADFAAVFRWLAEELAAFVQAPPDTYPEPVPHCDVCNWWTECETRRRADDHLSYTAGISARQMEVLRTLGVLTLTALARWDDIESAPRANRDALTRLRDQARLQVDSRGLEVPQFCLREPIDASHGLALLPLPSPNDVFLDLEGDHFAEGGGHEYLFGWLAMGADGQHAYQSHWAGTRAAERAAFEAFMDVATAVRTRDPGAHIYHFAPYEPSALKRLASRYATRESELDALLRAEAFVDLYAVVRGGLMAGVERYSIKDLEPLFGYRRAQALDEAGMSRRLIETAIESGGLDDSLAGHRAIVEDYNREDCESALRLRDWLESLRTELEADGVVLPRPSPGSGTASEKVSALDERLATLRDGLLASLPADESQWKDSDRARFLLAHLLGFQRREDKAAWWEFFRLRDLDDEQRRDERRAVVGLVFDSEISRKSKTGKTLVPIHRYRFPGQEIDARPGDDLKFLPLSDANRAVAVATADGSGPSRDNAERNLGSVEALDVAEGWLDVKKRKDTVDTHPETGFFFKIVRAEVLLESLERFGTYVADHGLVPAAPYAAAVRLLERGPSALCGPEGSLCQPGESAVKAACRLCTELDGQVLAIQGPPGAGKTYTGAHVIATLVAAELRVGVAAVSHRVIDNLLSAAIEVAEASGVSLDAAHRDEHDESRDPRILSIKVQDDALAALQGGAIQVLGATAWTWARQDFEQAVDVLVVDEAGQMSLANTLACAPAALGLVLLGDPQQLEQPLQASHPEGSDVSALAHWLDGAATRPEDRGLFLATTWRLHPDIARFTSEIYYEERLSSEPGLDQQTVMPLEGRSLPVSGSGLRYLPVVSKGNTARSAEEVTVIADLARRLLNNAQWRNRHGGVARISADDLLIVAPYNAQVAALQASLPELSSRIGTVDKFQGQEAAVVIYSMTSSSPDDAPRGMAFLYDPHRFNVATSRARALCVLVGEPSLFSPRCQTPRQLALANAFCRFRELAQTIELPA